VAEFEKSRIFSNVSPYFSHVSHHFSHVFARFQPFSHVFARFVLKLAYLIVLSAQKLNFYCNQLAGAENRFMQPGFKSLKKHIFFLSTVECSAYDDKKQFACRLHRGGRYSFDGYRHRLCLLRRG
jgi:hypothetical protein